MSEDVVTRFIDSLLSAFDRDEGVADKAVESENVQRLPNLAGHQAGAKVCLAGDHADQLGHRHRRDVVPELTRDL
jgi:hypothetical protein